MKKTSGIDIFLARGERIKRAPPKKMCFNTQATIRMNDVYFHKTEMGECIYSPSCMFDYKITISVKNASTNVKLYTEVNGQLHLLIPRNHVSQDSPLTVLCVFKTMYIVTSDDCVLRVHLSPKNQEKTKLECHGVTFVLSEGRTKLIMKHNLNRSQREPLPLQFLPAAELPTLAVSIKGMKYYLNTSSILTLSKSVDDNLSYPPYSVQLLRSSKYRAKLSYVLKLKTSEEFAKIIISAISSLTSDTYTTIKKDDTNEDLANAHIGNTVSGSFILPVGCLDVGLHIYTPYGFSGDIEDPFVNLCVFETLNISYIKL